MADLAKSTLERSMSGGKARVRSQQIDQPTPGVVTGQPQSSLPREKSGLVSRRGTILIGLILVGLVGLIWFVVSNRTKVVPVVLDTPTTNLPAPQVTAIAPFGTWQITQEQCQWYPISPTGSALQYDKLTPEACMGLRRDGETIAICPKGKQPVTTCNLGSVPVFQTAPRRPTGTFEFTSFDSVPVRISITNVP